MDFCPRLPKSRLQPCQPDAGAEVGEFHLAGRVGDDQTLALGSQREAMVGKRRLQCRPAAGGIEQRPEDLTKPVDLLLVPPIAGWRGLLAAGLLVGAIT